MNNVDTLVADKVTSDLIDKYTDSRIKKSMLNVQQACFDLIEKKIRIDKDTISSQLVEHYGSKPAKKTLHNDPKGIYGTIITAYGDCNPANKIKYGNKTIGHRKSSVPANDLPLEVQIYIQQLENVVHSQQLQLDKFFAEDTYNNVLDIDKMLNHKPNEHGQIDLARVNGLNSQQLFVLKLILGIDEDTGGIPIELSGSVNERVGVDKDTGQLILRPPDFIELMKLFADEQ